MMKKTINTKVVNFCNVKKNAKNFSILMYNLFRSIRAWVGKKTE